MLIHRRACARAGCQRRGAQRRALAPICAAAPAIRTSSKRPAPWPAKCASSERPECESNPGMASASVKSKTKHVGQSLTRLEDRPLQPVAGRFAADISFPQQLHMRIVRSNFAHGKLRGLSTRRKRWRCPAYTRCGPRRRRSTSRPYDFLLEPESKALEAYRQRLFADGDRAVCRRAGRRGIRRRPYLAEDAAELVNARHRGIAGAVFTPRSRRASSSQGRSTETAIVRKGYGELDAAFQAAHLIVTKKHSRSGAIPACRSRPAARSRAMTAPATFSSCTAPPRCRIGTGIRSPACGREPPPRSSVRRPCRRRLRHSRRDLSGGRAGLRRGTAAAAGRSSGSRIGASI